MKSSCFVLLTACHAQSCMAQAQQAPILLPDVTVTQSGGGSLSDTLPSAIGLISTIELNAVSPGLRQIDQAVVDSGFAVVNASNSLGLASGISVRGFSVTSQGSSSLQVGRNFLNGHADLVWRFSRDPVTLSQVQLISGSDATLLGAGSPAASILYTSKVPEGVESHKVGLALGSNSLKRLTGDVEWHWGPVQTRAVFAVQRDDKGVEGVADGRNVLLISIKIAVGKGAARLDLEYHQSTLPFPFGTAYAGGKFWYDQPYVDARAQANRQYSRHALYLEHPIGESAQASAYWQQGKSSRDERLVGFFDTLNATQLRGYYRTIDENNQQSDAGIKLTGKLRTGAVTHQWAATAQYLGLTRDFAGPQSIGGFTLDLTNPVFPADLSALTLAPRYAFERYVERGLALADTARWGGWEGRIGIRRSSYQLDASTSLGKPPDAVSTAEHTSTSFGLAKQITDTQRLWISNATSFLPNRGRFSGGAFLPPSESSQWELGLQYRKDRNSVSLAAFDLRQSNLPARDPSDPDALVLIGSNRSQGVEVRADFHTGALHWQAAATQMNARVEDRVSATQGGYLVGTPDAYGSLRVSTPLPGGLQAWASVQGAGSRPGDDKNSFSTPGYGVMSLGLQSNLSDGKSLRWGASVQNLADISYVRALTGADNVWQGPRRSLQVWVDLPL